MVRRGGEEVEGQLWIGMIHVSTGRYRGKLSGGCLGVTKIQRPGRELPFKVDLTSLLSFQPL